MATRTERVKIPTHRSAPQIRTRGGCSALGTEKFGSWRTNGLLHNLPLESLVDHWNWTELPPGLTIPQGRVNISNKKSPFDGVTAYRGLPRNKEKFNCNFYVEQRIFISNREEHTIFISDSP